MCFRLKTIPSLSQCARAHRLGAIQGAASDLLVGQIDPRLFGESHVNIVHTRLRPSTLYKLNPFVGAEVFRNTRVPSPDAAFSCIPSGPNFIALLEAFRATGGTAPGDVVARLLEDHFIGDAVSLAMLIHTGQVFGLEWRGSLWIPMFQFDPDDLSTQSSAQEVRAMLPSLWGGWRVASWFSGPNIALNGQRPVDLLESNTTAVLAAASTRQDALMT